MEKNSVAVISIGRRPILSANVLNVSDPTRIPNRAALKTGPNAPVLEQGWRGITHCLYVEAVDHQAHAAQDTNRDME
jgi:hypothetical protein